MQSAMNPIDAKVGEHQEERHAEEQVGPAVVVDVGVDAAVAAPLQPVDGSRQHHHPRHALERDRDLVSDLARLDGCVLGSQ